MEATHHGSDRNVQDFGDVLIGEPSTSASRTAIRNCSGSDSTASLTSASVKCSSTSSSALRPAASSIPSSSDHAPEDRRTAAISGVAAFPPQLEDYKRTDGYQPTESWLERKFRVKQEKKERQEKLLKDGPSSVRATLSVIIFFHLSDFWAYVSSLLSALLNYVFPDHPQDDPNIRGDVLKTLIVARLAMMPRSKISESEFGRFGPIERVCCHTPPTSLNYHQIKILLPVCSDVPTTSCPLLTRVHRYELLSTRTKMRNQTRRRRNTVVMHLWSMNERKTGSAPPKPAGRSLVLRNT